MTTDSCGLATVDWQLACGILLLQTTMSATIDVTEILRAGVEATDAALERLLPAPDAVPSSIHRAMRHSTFAGGKRLRPVLAMEAARTLRRDRALPAGVEDLGAAIEMLHTYSLIHDDLPALDNDDLRRGKPTCHVVFGEAVAILAGDALQTLAYQTLAQLRCPAPATVEIIRLIAEATGTVEGMIGGQVLDLEGEGTKPTAESVDAIHRAKTGALIRVSIVTGGVYAGATPDDVERLTLFGRKAGLAFQIVDDVLDVTQDSAHLGKTAGKDLTSDKATWPAVFGIEASRRDAARLIDEAFAALEPYGSAADGLKTVARYLVERTN
jgi:geranylgeranyl diphosphate synthase type II